MFTGKLDVKNRADEKEKLIQFNCGVERKNGEIKFIFVNGEKCANNTIDKNNKGVALKMENDSLNKINEVRKELNLKSFEIEFDGNENNKNENENMKYNKQYIESDVDRMLESTEKIMGEKIDLMTDNKIKEKVKQEIEKIITKIKTEKDKAISNNKKFICNKNNNDRYLLKVNGKVLIVEFGCAPTIYYGDYKNCKREGKGTMIYPRSGKIYCGSWKDNFKNGLGVSFDCLYNGIIKYLGLFKDGLCDGCGKFCVSDKKVIYSKDWDKGKVLNGVVIEKKLSNKDVITEYIEKEGEGRKSVLYDKKKREDFEKINNLNEKIENIETNIRNLIKHESLVQKLKSVDKDMGIIVNSEENRDTNYKTSKIDLL